MNINMYILKNLEASNWNVLNKSSICFLPISSNTDWVLNPFRGIHWENNILWYWKNREKKKGKNCIPGLRFSLWINMSEKECEKKEWKCYTEERFGRVSGLVDTFCMWGQSKTLEVRGVGQDSERSTGVICGLLWASKERHWRDHRGLVWLSTVRKPNRFQGLKQNRVCLWREPWDLTP